ncbi:MAG: DUF748 domain-containing protein [Chitinophagales bacterium]
MVKLLDKRWKKIIVITLSVIVLFVVLVIAFISPIAKYIIEKYDEKWLGRQITINWIYVNPFTGYAHINGLKLYEQNKDSVFVSAASVNVNFAITKLFSKTYELSSVTLNRPVFHLIQNRNQFNFSDLITRFTPKDTLAPKDTTPVKFNILDIEINKGIFYYDELSIPVHYYITDLDIQSPGKRWDVDSINYKIQFRNGPGEGSIGAKGAINLKSLDYNVKAVVEKFDLKIFEQYLHDLANYGSLAANLDADVHVSGNFSDQLALELGGYIGVNDFHFGKTEGDDFASFQKVGMNIKYMNPLKYEYIFDTLSIIKPFFKFERYDQLDNLQRMFGAGGENYKAAKADSSKFNLIIAIADFVKELGKNFIKSHYKANQVAIYDGNFGFNDFALREKFAVAATPLTLISKDIDRDNAYLKVDMKTDVFPHGQIDVGFGVTPKDFGNFDLAYSVKELAVPDLNPYTITYTSFPFKSGTINFNGNWKVRNRNIESMNHLVILNPQLTKRIKKKDTRWIPMPLILAVVKEPGNYIDYEIPIRGNLNDPKVNVWDIILDVLRNLFVKPPTTPYRVYVKNLQNEVEKYQIFRWNMHQVNLSKKQEKFAEKLAEFMKKNPEAKVYIQPVSFEAKEKEHFLLYEAKKKYFLMTNKKSADAFSEEDSLAVEKMSVKDSQFVAMLNKDIDSSELLFTIQEKCTKWVDTGVVYAKAQRLEAKRKAVFMEAFKDEGVSRRLVFSSVKVDVPRTGFSYFRISYDGDVPDNLVKALENLDEDVDKVLVSNAKEETKREARKKKKE